MALVYIAFAALIFHWQAQKQSSNWGKFVICLKIN